jgi:hypothetical protein
VTATRAATAAGVGLLVALAALVALAGCGTADAGARLGPVVQVVDADQGAHPPSLHRPTAVAGRLVEGFPDQVPVPAGAHVTASAVEDRGELLAVSVTGTSKQPVADLLAFFRSRLTRAGFTATEGSLLPAGASGAAFGRSGGAEMLIVAVIDRGGERSFSIGGTVRPR